MDNEPSWSWTLDPKDQADEMAVSETVSHRRAREISGLITKFVLKVSWIRRLQWNPHKDSESLLIRRIVMMPLTSMMTDTSRVNAIRAPKFDKHFHVHYLDERVLSWDKRLMTGINRRNLLWELWGPFIRNCAYDDLPNKIRPLFERALWKLFLLVQSVQRSVRTECFLTKSSNLVI